MSPTRTNLAEAPQTLGLLCVGRGLVVQGDDAGGAQNGLAQPSHAEEQQQRADDKLHASERNPRQRRPEQGDGHEKREERRAAAAERAAPAAHRSHRENDRQRLDELDQRGEKGGEHRGPRMDPVEIHRCAPDRALTLALPSSKARAAEPIEATAGHSTAAAPVRFHLLCAAVIDLDTVQISVKVAA